MKYLIFILMMLISCSLFSQNIIEGLGVEKDTVYIDTGTDAIIDRDLKFAPIPNFPNLRDKTTGFFESDTLLKFYDPRTKFYIPYRNQLSISDFSPKGDGITNDSLAFLQLLNWSASTGQDAIIDSGIFNLNNATINLPLNVTLTFKGGILKNAVLIGNNNNHVSSLQQCYENVTISGAWGNVKAHPEWFNLSDGLTTFDAIVQAGHMGNEVIFQSKEYELKHINTSHNLSSGSDLRNIHWTGQGDSTIIYLTTRHYGFRGYFSNNNGNNLRLKNLRIETSDYRNKAFGEVVPYYLVHNWQNSFYTPEMKPEAEYIIIENVTLNGDISILYGADDGNQTLEEFAKKEITQIDVSNCRTNYNNSFIGVANIPVTTAHFSKSSFRNFVDDPLSFPVSGMTTPYYDIINDHEGILTIDRCKFYNDTIFEVPSVNETVAPVVSKGFKEFYFTNNVVENLLITGNVGGEVNTFYSTAPYNVATNNKFKDVIGRTNLGGNLKEIYLVKVRGGKTNIFRDNDFEITRDGLFKIGVLDDINQDLSTLNQDESSIRLLWYGSQTEFDKNFIFIDNRVSTPILNTSSDIWGIRNFEFINNSINVEYWGSITPTAISRRSTLFWYRQRVDRIDSLLAAPFISKGNEIIVGDFEEPYFDYVHVNVGVQNGSSSVIDSLYNYSGIVMEDRFFVDSVVVGFDVLDGGQQTVNPTILGKGSGYEIRNFSGVNSQRPNVKQISTKVKIAELGLGNNTNLANGGLVAWHPDANQEVSIDENKMDSLILISFFNSPALYNFRKELPIDLFFDITYTDSAGRVGYVEYRMLYDSLYRSLYFFDKNLNTGNGVDANSGSGYLEVQSYPKNNQDISLHLKKGAFAHFVLRGLSDIRSLNIRTRFKKRPLALTDPLNDKYVDISDEYYIIGNALSGYDSTYVVDSIPTNVAWFNEETGLIQKSNIDSLKIGLGTNKHYRLIQILNDTTEFTTQTLLYSYRIPSYLDGTKLTGVYYTVADVGSGTGTNVIQFLINGTIETAFNSSFTNESFQEKKGIKTVSEGDRLQFCVDEITGIPPKGLNVEFEFRE